VVVNEKSGNVSVVDTNVEVGAITGTVKVAAGESKTEITVTETPAANGKIEIAKNAVVDIKTEGEAKITAEDLTIGEGAKVTINGNLVGESAAPVSRTVAATGLTIPAKTEVVVNGKIGAGVVITIEGDNGLTVNGEVETGAKITAKTQEAFKIGDKTKVNEVITLELAKTEGVVLGDVTPLVPYKVSGDKAMNYGNPKDVDKNTVLVLVMRPEGTTGKWNYSYDVTSGEEQGPTSGKDKIETEARSKFFYFSLSKLTDGNGNSTGNPFNEGEVWTITTVDGSGVEHVSKFTAWAGPEAQGKT